MRRCLILANQTLSSDTLHRTLKERVSAEPHEFYVVAPATPTRDGTGGAGSRADAPSDADLAYALAEQRLGNALEELRSLGATAEGEVGDQDPVQAVGDALARFPADEIVVSTLPRAVSQWLRRDVPARLRKAFPVPVSHLQADK